MADCNLTRAHSFPSDVATTKLHTLVGKFQESYGNMIESVTWADDKRSATAEGKMFTAQFGVTDSAINAEIELKGFAAKMAKGMIQQKLDKTVSDEFPA
jgi:uncharacterized protein YjdB